MQTISASQLHTKDVIEVPVEACVIVSVSKIPGQLKNRSNRLIEITVSPLSGPWANCEGKFVVESSDLIPIVKRYTKKDRRRESFRAFIQKVKEKIFGPKIEEVSVAIPNKVDAPWT